MADENVTPQSETPQGEARRTLKLRPATANPAGTSLADPMRGDTDTSNLDVLDDTQTRKTIKIKPLNPTTPQVNIGTLPKTPGATPLSGTQTRKTVVLKPQSAVQGATPLSGTQTRKAVVLKPQSAAQGATPLSGTQTRKTVVLSPVSKPQTPEIPPAAPAPAPAVAPANETDDTVTRKATVIAPADDDKTVKISRPQLSKPAVDPKRTVKLGALATPAAPAAPAAAVPPAPAAKPAVPPAPAAKPAAAVPPAPAAKPVAAIPPASAKEESIEVAPKAAVPPPPPVMTAPENDKEDSSPKSMLDDLETPVKDTAENKPSIFYTVIAAISLIMIIATAAFTAAQYLDYNHKVLIYDYVPGLPHAGK